MSCGLKFTCPPPRREKFGPTSVRSSSRALTRYQIRRVGADKPPTNTVGPTTRTDGANFVLYKVWKNGTKTHCPALF
jgi:hypothetical protein